MTAKGEVAPIVREALAWIGPIPQIEAHSCHFIFVQILNPPLAILMTLMFTRLQFRIEQP